MEKQFLISIQNNELENDLHNHTQVNMQIT